MWVIRANLQLPKRFYSFSLFLQNSVGQEKVSYVNRMKSKKQGGDAKTAAVQCLTTVK